MNATSDGRRNSQCHSLAREDGVDHADDLRHPLDNRIIFWDTE
jgi:hypothetical protein